MTLWKTERYAPLSATGGAGRNLDLATLAAIALAPALLLVWLVPHPLIPPVICIAAFAIACTAAFFAHRYGANRRAFGIKLWDIAGLSALIWAGAGLTSDPKYFVQLFEHLTMTQ